MSFGREFDQSPMDSFLFKKGDRSNYTTPIKTNNNLISTTNITSTMTNENMNDINNDKNHDHNSRATKYDYLDYGNYINRVLSSSQLLINGMNNDGINNGNEINWNLPRTSDKVNVINAMLAIIENKKLYESLLSQSRDTIETLKIDLHSNEMKIRSLSQENKKINQNLNDIFQRKESLEIELKKQTSFYREKLKTLTKENENLKYRDKKYQNDIRKKEKIHKQQQEKIKKLLDERDKKSMKCLGFKLLNQQIPTSILNHPNSLNSNKNVLHKNNQRQQNEINQEKHNRLLDENNMLQSQIAHFQKQLQSVLNENNLLRESLLKLEINCKDTLIKVNDLFANNSNKIQSINSYKYSMPINNDTNNLINNDIEESIDHLGNVLDELKINIDQTNNEQNIQRMKSEIVHLNNTIQELQETNKEYESLIRTYVNSE